LSLLSESIFTSRKICQPIRSKKRPKWQKIGALFDRNLSEISVSLSVLLRHFRAQFKGRRGSAERETETPDGWLARAAKTHKFDEKKFVELVRRTSSTNWGSML
jgi:hypothetical protein